MAMPGEFTLRAFLNGKFDLSQAEAVADLIASKSIRSRDMALSQMRGGYSSLIQELRKQLLDFASLLELELDFSEEEVEFADRRRMKELLFNLKSGLKQMLESFRAGNAIKMGIPVAIIGKPNVGKSTLLNALLNEEKAIVSDVPGTTRDAIEDTIVLEGYPFRFIDTAGLHRSEDRIENLGMDLTRRKIEQARIVLYVCDVSECSKESVKEMLLESREYMQNKSKKFILVGYKTDILSETPPSLLEYLNFETIFISAKRKENINLIMQSLIRIVKAENMEDKVVVSNTRHYEALHKALMALKQVEEGLDSSLTADLLSIDIKEALYQLGLVTGEITHDEILGNIFSQFCIGK